MPAAISNPRRTPFMRRILLSLDYLVENKMVGTARFELATSRTPSVRATRLRYVPTGASNNDAARIERAESRQLLHHQGYHRRSRSVKKACNASRRSSSILRLSNCDPPSPE